MRRLSRSTFRSVGGVFKEPEEGICWNRHGPEEIAFPQAQARGDTLVFGRRICDHMAGFRPTPAAAHPGVRRSGV